MCCICLGFFGLRVVALRSSRYARRVDEYIHRDRDSVRVSS
jgi:hypothetical protein